MDDDKCAAKGCNGELYGGMTFEKGKRWRQFCRYHLEMLEQTDDPAIVLEATERALANMTEKN